MTDIKEENKSGNVGDLDPDLSRWSDEETVAEENQ